MSGRLGPVLVILALGVVLYLPGLGREILRHPLEAKYALAAREMVRGGPWLVAHLFGEIYPDKPPLFFWAAAGVAELRGDASTRYRRGCPRRSAASRASSSRWRSARHSSARERAWSAPRSWPRPASSSGTRGRVTPTSSWSRG